MMSQGQHADCFSPVEGSKRVAVLVAAALVAALLGYALPATSAAQTDSVTFSGTVTAQGGASVANVMVSVMIPQCWDEVACEALADDASDRPQPWSLWGQVAFLGETGVDDSGNWSVTVSGFSVEDGYSLGYPLLVVWDRGGNLATRFIDGTAISELWDWESLSGISVELVAGGRISGQFAKPSGGPVPDGDYVLVDNVSGQSEFYTVLEVDLQTGDFSSPPVAPGEYGIAYGNLGDDYMNNNAAARVEVVAGQTASTGTLEFVRSGSLSGRVTDSSGAGFGNVRVSGSVSSQNAFSSMPYSPFYPNGQAYFYAATDEDGTYSVDSIVPGNDWEVQFEGPRGMYVPLSYTAISAGDEHSCAIAADQAIKCWGYDGRGAWAGRTDAPDGQYTAISAGAVHSCAIAADQTIDCWGPDSSGRLDAPAGQYTAISVGFYHSCAIAADQTIACWGSNELGRLDAPAGQFTAISVGFYHSCAIAADQTIACWGSNELGLSDAPAGQYTSISATARHSCAIAADQSIECWGGFDFSEFDLPADTQFNAISDAPAGQYTAISAGGWYSCAIAVDQTIACWGENPLHPDYMGEADAPAGQYTAISSGSKHSCAIAVDQTIACWGERSSGRTSPVNRVYEETLYEEVVLSGVAVESGASTTCIDVQIRPTTPTSGSENESAQHLEGAQFCAGAQDGTPQDGEVALDDISVRDQLIANQESLLNTYRCLFSVDTEAVPGGCADGNPSQGPTQPGTYEGTPTGADVAVRDELIANQESLLNTYRCLFNIDTQIVPGGCAP